MSRVLLSKIRSITLYKDELTKARRLPAIPQLTCIGSPCRLFQPDVVRCYNNGGEGVDVDWTCEADLPEKLRFGRTDVSCEGWDYAGDSYVLKGSCGLEYRLINTDSSYKLPLSAAEKLINYFFMLLSAAIFLFILSQIFKQCCTRRSGPLDSNTNNNPNSRRSPNYYTYPSSSSQPPDDDNDAPPPPYTPYSRSGAAPPKKNGSNNNNNRNSSNNGNNSVPPSNNNNNNNNAASGSGPGGLGFWSGVGLGGLGGLAAGRQFFGGGGNRGSNNNGNSRNNGGGVGGGGYRPGWGPEYDWERQRGGGSSRVHFPSGSRNGGSGSGSSGGSGGSGNGNGSGSGSLGSMRRSTGYGTTNVR